MCSVERVFENRKSRLQTASGFAASPHASIWLFDWKTTPDSQGPEKEYMIYSSIFEHNNYDSNLPVFVPLEGRFCLQVALVRKHPDNVFSQTLLDEVY